MSSIEASYTDHSNKILHFNIEVDHQTEVVTALNFSGDLVSAHSVELEVIRSFSLGKTVSELFESGHADIFHHESPRFVSLVHSLLYKCLNDFKGRGRGLRSSSDMLCLCFGVTKTEFTSLIENQTNVNFAELIAQTKITSACGGCLKHAQELLGTKLNSPVVAPIPSGVLISGMTTDDLLIYVDHKISSWIKKENLTDNLKVSILSISGAHIFLNVETSSLELMNQTEIIKKLNIYINQQLRSQVFLHF